MPGETLRLALEANRNRIEAGIREAESDLRECEKRCTALRELIDRGRTALGDGDDWTPNAHRTLNDAMKLVLGEHGGPMVAPAILAEVRSRRLYRTRSGAPLSLNQIHARVYHDPDTFERTPQGIQLRPS